MTLSLETDPYNVLKDKRDKLYQIYETGNYIEPPQSKEETVVSHIEATTICSISLISDLIILKRN